MKSYPTAFAFRRALEDRLKRDIADTFQRRQTHPVPEELEPPPGFWGPVFTKLALECDIDVDIDVQFEKVSRFCYGIL